MENEKTTIKSIINDLENLNKEIQKIKDDIFEYDDNIINDKNCWDMNDELIEACKHIFIVLKMLNEIQGGKRK